MSEIAQLLAAIDHLSPRIPITVDLWSVKEISAYLKRAPTVVRDHIVAQPGFPPAIRLPADGGKGRRHPLWKAREVIAWAERHQERAA